MHLSTGYFYRRCTRTVDCRQEKKPDRTTVVVVVVVIIITIKRLCMVGWGQTDL